MRVWAERALARYRFLRGLDPAPDGLNDAGPSWYRFREVDAIGYLHVGDNIGAFAPAAPLLSALEGVESVQLTIDSSGGSLPETFALHTRLRGSTPTCTVHRAISSSVLLVQAAEHRTIASAGKIVLHAPACAIFGTGPELRHAADELDHSLNQQLDILCGRSGLATSKVKPWLESGMTVFTAEEAKQLNLVDEVLLNPSAPAGSLLDRLHPGSSLPVPDGDCRSEGGPVVV